MYVQNLHPKKQIINVLIFMHDESQNTFSMEGSSDSLDKFCEILKNDVLEIILNIGLTIEEIGLTIEEEFK